MLTVGALVVFVAMLANFFLQSSALMLALLVLCLGIFSAFILVDLKRVIDGGETNYISATLAVYMDVFNVFQSLLALLGIFGGERE
jgi:modulator of FtsH protease